MSAMRFRLGLSLVVAAVLLPPLAGAAQRPRPVARFPGLSSPVALDTAGPVWKAAVPAAVAFGRLRAIYSDLKVPLAIDDSVTGTLGTLRLIRVRTLGGRAMSNYLNCGGDVSGPLANTGKVTLALVTMVLPAGDSIAIRTALIAAAQSLEGSARDPVSCYTSGKLEQEIFKQVTSPGSGG